MTHNDSIKLRLAKWLDSRIRGICWPTLALWGMRWNWFWEIKSSRPCERESKLVGCCWCGKFCDAKVMAERAK